MIGRGSLGLEENVIPFFKRGKKEDPENYRPASLTLICWKAMEQIFQESISKCMKKKVVTVSGHHRFINGKPCLSSLIASTMKRLSGEGEKNGSFLDSKQGFRHYLP